MASLFLNNNRPTSHHEEYNSEEIVKKYIENTHTEVYDPQSIINEWIENFHNKPEYHTPNIIPSNC